jgi:imidazolonepropionase-like amidohydrolase
MRLLIDDAIVWNGTGAAPFPGKVLIEGERIIAVAPQSESLAADGADRIDAAGKFLMPGMVEGHAHLSFVDTPRGTALGELPPEDHALLTMDAARKLLGAGFTSACSAAAAKIRLDVAVRDAIDQGLVDGPRLLAASPELTVTGGLGDGRKLHLHQESFGIAVDGPDEVRRMARLCLREGVDTIKLNISGAADAVGALGGHRDDRRRGRSGRRGCPRDRSPGGGSRTRLGCGEVRPQARRRRDLPLRLRRR